VLGLGASESFVADCQQGISGEWLLVAGDRYTTFLFYFVTKVNNSCACFFSVSVEEAKPVYSWLQENDSIIISFELLPATAKSDIEFDLKTDSLTVGLKDRGVLLSGDLYGKVDVDGSSWFISDNNVYVDCYYYYYP